MYTLGSGDRTNGSSKSSSAIQPGLHKILPQTRQLEVQLRGGLAGIRTPPHTHIVTYFLLFIETILINSSMSDVYSSTKAAVSPPSLPLLSNHRSGVVVAFREACGSRRTLAWAGKMLMQFWKHCDISDCIRNFVCGRVRSLRYECMVSGIRHSRGSSRTTEDSPRVRRQQCL